MVESRWQLIVTAIIGVVGILGPIAWDWWSSRTSLTLQHQSTSVLAERAEGLDSLQIRWGNKTYSSVAVVNFRLQNTGTTSLRSEGTYQPPTVRFLNGKVLSIEAVSARPTNTQFRTTIGSRNRNVSVPFTLLNPSDQIDFSVVVADPKGELGTYNPTFEAQARIAGLEAMSVERPTDESESPPVGELSLLTKLVLSISVVMTLLFLVGLWQFGAEYRIKHLVENGVLRLPPALTGEQYREWVNRVMPNKADKEMENINKVLGSVSDEEPIDQEEYEQLETTFFNTATDLSLGQTALLTLFLFSAAGYAFVLTSVLG